jgi:hypothetical protein
MIRERTWPRLNEFAVQMPMTMIHACTLDVAFTGEHERDLHPARVSTPVHVPQELLHVGEAL